MALDIQVTFDVHDLEVMSRFWALALDYEEEPPPPGFSSWEDFAERNQIPPELWRAAVVDPERRRPRLFFQRAPEGKTGCSPRRRGRGEGAIQQWSQHPLLSCSARFVRSRTER